MNKFSRKALWIRQCIATLLAALFLVLGLVGLVTPLFPGLVFLALALFIMSSVVPPLERWLRQFRILDQAHDQFRNFQRLPLAAKRSALTLYVSRYTNEVGETLARAFRKFAD